MPLTYASCNSNETSPYSPKPLKENKDPLQLSVSAFKQINIIFRFNKEQRNPLIIKNEIISPIFRLLKTAG